MPNGQPPWTDEDIAFLLRSEHLSNTQAAATLGRTVAAVQTKRVKLRRNGYPIARQSKAARTPVIGTRSVVAKTCSRCGLMLDALWFGKRSDGRWNSACRACLSAKPQGNVKTWRERAQAMTAEVATRNGFEWTSQDMEVLADERLTAMERAVVLQRSLSAVTDARWRFGYANEKPALGEPVETWVIRRAVSAT